MHSSKVKDSVLSALEHVNHLASDCLPSAYTDSLGSSLIQLKLQSLTLTSLLASTAKQQVRRGHALIGKNTKQNTHVIMY